MSTSSSSSATNDSSVLAHDICMSYLSWPASIVCSGHGECLTTPSGMCQCDDGWHGRNEWTRHNVGHDCNTNTKVISALHIVGLCMVIGVLIAAFLLIRKRYRRHIRTNPLLINLSPQHRTMGRWSSRYYWRVTTIIFADPPARLGIYIVGFCAFTFPYHLQRLLDSDGSEMVSSWGTVLCAMGAGVMFWTQATLFVWVLIQSSTTGMVSHGAARATAQLARMHLLLRAGRMIGWCSGLSQVFIRLGGVHNNEAMSRAGAQMYLIFGGCCGVYTLSSSTYFTYRVVDIIGSLEDPRLEPTRKRLLHIAHALLASINALGIMFIAAAWPWMMTYGSYLAPIILYSATFAAAMGTALFLSAATNTNNGTMHGNYVIDDSLPIVALNQPPHVITVGAAATTATGPSATTALTSTNSGGSVIGSTTTTTTTTTTTVSSPKTPKPSRASSHGNGGGGGNGNHGNKASRRLSMPYNRDAASPINLVTPPNRTSTGSPSNNTTNNIHIPLPYVIHVATAATAAAATTTNNTNNTIASTSIATRLPMSI